MPVGDIVQCATTSQKLFAHHDAAGTSELGPYMVFLDVHKKRTDVLDMQAVVTDSLANRSIDVASCSVYLSRMTVTPSDV